MSPDDLAQASEHVKSAVLSGLLWILFSALVYLAIRHLQIKQQNRTLRSRELQGIRQVTVRATEVEALREKLMNTEAELAAARRQERRAVAIRKKTEHRLTEQNTEIDALRRDRDWLKRIVDHVET